MKKYFLALVLLIFAIFASNMNAYAYSDYDKIPAQKSQQKIFLDGKQIEVGAYLIDSRNYVRLRDVAAVLNNTGSKFGVSYDNLEKCVLIKTNESYDKMPDDLKPFTAVNTKAFIHSPKIKIDGAQKYIRAGLINGNNYFQLRELSEYLDFGVDYNEKTKSVEIYTTLKEKTKGKIDQKYLNERAYSLVEQGLSYKEAELAERINEYRRQNGKPEFNISKSLTVVARTHVKDSNSYSPENQKDARGIQGNLHSWSNNGSWRGMVYTPDHHYSEFMWSKPRELTNYKASGFEISAKGYETPEAFLEGWKTSPAHNNVLTGSGSWDKLKCMGVAIDGDYSHIWFGMEEDPDGYYWKK